MDIQNTEVIIVGELTKSELASHVYELATLAKQLGSKVSVVLSAGLAQQDFSSDVAAQNLGNHGVSEMHSVDCGTGLSGAALSAYIAKLERDAREKQKQVVILGPQTYLGRDVLAHLSVELDRPVLANATGVEFNDSGIQTQHGIFGGTKIVTAQTTVQSPFLAIVRPKSIAPDEPQSLEPAQIVQGQAAELVQELAQTNVVSSETVQSQGPELEDATIVVAGGRGMGSKENYESLVSKCAQVLGAATGASRAIVDAGWVPYSKQVGQTGKTVKPDIYIACGISGATQHLVGMKGAKNIIAINTDDQAPIFSIADLGIVGDVNVVLPQLIEKLESIKK